MKLTKRTRARFVETELADDDSRIGNFGAKGERGGEDRRLILTVGTPTAYYDMELSREETLDLSRWMMTQGMVGEWSAMRDALRVIVGNRHIKAYLESNNRKALEQCRNALDLVERP